MKNIFGDDFNVVHQLDFNGRQMLVVELKTMRYVDGLATRFVVVSPDQFDRTGRIQNTVEIVND